jgi:hypothetical protein
MSQWQFFSPWLNFAGIILNLAGAVILAYGAINTRRRAEELTIPIYGGNKAAVDDRMSMSRNSVIGISILALGFLLQLPANLPTLEASSSDKDVVSKREAAKPTYDSRGWTQENTGSAVVGPWLNYDPPGTRYCRYATGTIYRLYPPGVRPNAEAANPFCVGDSTAEPPK